MEPLFLGENGSAALKQEIETFNNITIVGNPRWLSRNRREGQQSGSLVFAVNNEETRATILKKGRLTIAGGTSRMVKYITSSPTSQCGHCQKFGHPTGSCKTIVCRFCAASHKTAEHSCSQCTIIGKPCEHTTPKCANCKGSHFSNSKDCDIWKAAKNIHEH